MNLDIQSKEPKVKKKLMHHLELALGDQVSKKWLR